MKQPIKIIIFIAVFLHSAYAAAAASHTCWYNVQNNTGEALTTAPLKVIFGTPANFPMFNGQIPPSSKLPIFYHPFRTEVSGDEAASAVYTLVASDEKFCAFELSRYIEPRGRRWVQVCKHDVNSQSTLNCSVTKVEGNQVYLLKISR